MTHDPVRAGDEDIWFFSIYRDRQGALWLGTRQHGVHKINGTAFEPFELDSQAR